MKITTKLLLIGIIILDYSCDSSKQTLNDISNNDEKFKE